MKFLMMINLLKDLLKYIKTTRSTIDNNEDDDSVEPVIISANEASKSLEIVYAFLLQQGNILYETPWNGLKKVCL